MNGELRHWKKKKKSNTGCCTEGRSDCCTLTASVIDGNCYFVSIVVIDEIYYNGVSFYNYCICIKVHCVVRIHSAGLVIRCLFLLRRSWGVTWLTKMYAKEQLPGACGVFDHEEMPTHTAEKTSRSCVLQLLVVVAECTPWFIISWIINY